MTTVVDPDIDFLRRPQRLYIGGEFVTTAGRLLVGLTMTADPVERALLLAPIDDEPDTDDDDGGLTEARQELARGEGISTEELGR